MSIAICNGSRVVDLVSDAANVGGFPHIVDGGNSFVYGLPFVPTFVHDVTVEAGIPLNLLICDGSAVTVDTGAYAEALIAAITAKLQALGDFGLARAAGGTTVSGFHYDTYSEAKSNLDAAFNLAGTASSPATFSWWMSTGWHSIPQAMILSDAPVVGAWYEANFTNTKSHWQAIEALTELGAVAAYDFSSGWPAGT